MEALRELELEDRLSYREGQETMITVLGSLDRHRRRVVALHCVFFDSQDMSFEEIGQEIGVSRARAGQ